MSRSERPERSRPDEIAESIRDQIAQGLLLPGQPLNQALLADQYGTSRVPVREALQALLSEGLVRSTPNIGFTVARLNENDLRSIYVMRALLERHVLLNCPSLNEDEIGQLRAINEQMGIVVDKSIARFQQLNFAFHFTIFRRFPYPLFIDELTRLWRMAEPYRLVWLSAAVHRDSVLTDHEAFIEALQENDRELLADVADRHREGVQTNLIPILAGRSQETES